MIAISRRCFIGQLAATSAFGSELLPIHAGNNLNSKYDFSDPSDNVEAALRLMCDISGKRTYFLSSGRLFGQLAGERAIPLFRFDALGTSRCTRLARDAYRRHYLNVVLIRDLDSNDVLKIWPNPFTSELLSPIHSFVGPGEIVLSSRGYVAEETYRGGLDASAGPPFKWDWHASGDTIWATRDVLTKTPRQAATGNNSKPTESDILTEFQTYRALLADFNDMSMTSVPCSMTMTARFGWFPWMKMAEHRGSLVWHSAGRKFAALADLPPSFVEEVESAWPNALVAPEKAKKVT